MRAADGTPATPDDAASSPWGRLLRTHRWLPFVLPFAVFMATGWIEPQPHAGTPSAGNVVTSDSTTIDEQAGDGDASGRDASGRLLRYPAAHVVRMGLTLFAILLVLPAWRAAPLRFSLLAVPVGLVGGVLWILICRMRIEDQFLTLIGLGDWAAWGDRPAFDPFGAFGEARWWMAAFLAVRLVGLTVIVPLIEEFFLRGFLMRFLLKADWWTIPLGTVTWGSGMIVIAYAVLSHPAEPIAAALWFTLITLLYARTRSLWDCVVAHGVTNGVLGVYILLWRDWTLW